MGDWSFQQMSTVSFSVIFPHKWISSTRRPRVIWEFVRNTGSQIPPRTDGIRVLFYQDPSDACVCETLRSTATIIFVFFKDSKGKPTETVIIFFKKRKCRWECGEIGTLRHCWWECKMVHPHWKTFWLFLDNLNISYCMTQEFHSWANTPKSWEWESEEKLYVNLHHSASHRSQKGIRPKCPLTDDG